MKKATSNSHSARPWLILLLLILLFLYLFTQSEKAQGQFPTHDSEKVLHISAATPSPAPPIDSAQQFKEERTAAWQNIQAVLDALRTNALGDDVRALAESALFQHVQDTQNTLLIENALHAMNYTDSVCAIQNGQITLFVSGILSSQDAALIYDLIQEWTHAFPDCIRIIQRT